MTKIIMGNVAPLKKRIKELEAEVKSLKNRFYFELRDKEREEFLRKESDFTPI